MKSFLAILVVLALLIFPSCNGSIPTGPEPFLETDSAFVSQPLGFEVTEANLRARYPSTFRVIRRAVQNKHDSTVMDTLITFESPENDQFFIYKTQSREIFKEARIRSNRFRLQSNIEIGMSRTQFANQMNVPDLANTMKFCNQEQTVNWVFYFKDAQLDSIWYEGYMD